MPRGHFARLLEDNLEQADLWRGYVDAAASAHALMSNADAIKKTIKGLPGIKKFLEKEAGLTIWHAEF